MRSVFDEHDSRLIWSPHPPCNNLIPIVHYKLKGTQKLKLVSMRTNSISQFTLKQLFGNLNKQYEFIDSPYSNRKQFVNAFILIAFSPSAIIINTSFHIRDIYRILFFRNHFTDNLTQITEIAILIQERVTAVFNPTHIHNSCVSLNNFKRIVVACNSLQS